jgi:hypothetical protein
MPDTTTEVCSRSIARHHCTRTIHAQVEVVIQWLSPKAVEFLVVFSARNVSPDFWAIGPDPIGGGFGSNTNGQSGTQRSTMFLHVSPCFSCLKPKISKMHSKEMQGHARTGVGLSFGKARPCDAAMLPRAGWHLTSWGLVGLSGCYETAPWIQERCAKAKFQSMLT